MIRAEQGGGAAPVPLARVEAERVGQFVAAKAGGDADVGVVEADGICAEEWSDEAKEDLRGAAAGGFAGDDDASGVAPRGTEGAKFVIVKLVKNEIPDDGGVVGVTGKRAEVGDVPAVGHGPRGRTRPAVEAVDGEPALRELEGEFAGPRAEFEEAFAGADELRERAGDPTVVAHDGVGEPEIAAVVERVRMLRRKRVEELGLDRAEHG